MQHQSTKYPWRLGLAALVAIACVTLGDAGYVLAEEAAAKTAAPTDLDAREIFRAGGVIGFIIIGLSIAMVALIVEHLISIRRAALMPAGLAEETHQLIAQGQFKQAQQVCHDRPSFLGHVLSAGLAESSLGYSAVEKAMEDASTEHSARLFRKIDYLSVIGTLAPMLGLLGTVWGLMLAFHEFELRTNPQVSELAPGIYKAMVTTLMGLSVAVPALAAFAFFRNRIDELVAETSLLAEHVFADFKRAMAARRKGQPASQSPRGETAQRAASPQPGRPIPPVAAERETTG